MTALLALAALLTPVQGEVVRGFEYGANPFAPGLHRGVDLRARPGARVLAPCTGTIVAAGDVAATRVVSLRCGRRRVSLQPLDRVAVRAGAMVVRGTRVGTVGRGHRGLHLGVRREGDPFGYVDPEPLLAAPPPPPVAPRIAPRRPGAPRPTAPPRTKPRPARGPRPAPVPRPAPPAVPWLAWPGLALVLAGAGVTGVRLARPRVGRWRAWSRASA